jgi:hypothetical protein
MALPCQDASDAPWGFDRSVSLLAGRSAEGKLAYLLQYFSLKHVSVVYTPEIWGMAVAAVTHLPAWVLPGPAWALSTVHHTTAISTVPAFHLLLVPVRVELALGLQSTRAPEQQTVRPTSRQC